MNSCVPVKMSHLMVLNPMFCASGRYTKTASMTTAGTTQAMPCHLVLDIIAFLARCGGGPGAPRPTTHSYYYLANSDAARTLSSTCSGVCVPPTSASPPASHASATSGTVTVSSQMTIWDASLARSMPSMMALLDVFSLTAPMTVLGCEYGVVASVEAFSMLVTNFMKSTARAGFSAFGLMKKPSGAPWIDVGSPADFFGAGSGNMPNVSGVTTLPSSSTASNSRISE